MSVEETIGLAVRRAVGLRDCHGSRTCINPSRILSAWLPVSPRDADGWGSPAPPRISTAVSVWDFRILGRPLSVPCLFPTGAGNPICICRTLPVCALTHTRKAPTPITRRSRLWDYRGTFLALSILRLRQLATSLEFGLKPVFIVGCLNEIPHTAIHPREQPYARMRRPRGL